MKAGAKTMSPEQRAGLVAAGRELKTALERSEARLVRLDAELQREGQRLPNATHPDAPIGDEDAARLLQKVHTPPEFSFVPKDHVALAESLDIVDFAAGSTVAGPKFYYLKREAALLELALVSYAMQTLTRRGYVPHVTPDLVKESVLDKCGFQPRADNTQVYSVANTSLCLTGTAEVPLGGLHMDGLLDEAQLPIRLAGVGHAFRTEAGAAGSAGRGLYRVHQFTKVEAFVLCRPEDSEALHQELVDIEVELFRSLGLHFRVLDMPTRDLGAPAYRKIDIEAWLPGMARYGEISSASNCTDFQARRLNIRYRPALTLGSSSDGCLATQKGGPTRESVATKAPASRFVHTLNATGCAVPRMLVAILENFQREDGSVDIPSALHPYMAGITRITPRR